MWLQQERSVENSRTPKSLGIDQCTAEFGYGNEKSWDSLENVMFSCLFLYESSFLGGTRGSLEIICGKTVVILPPQELSAI